MAQLVLSISEWMNFSGITSFFSRIEDSFREKRDMRKTYAELSRLNDKELADIGISRSDIMSIASGNYQRSVGR